ncbi:MAG: hypothetical protein HY254_23555 [Burkholderiales bacterium]|nr:hypothetical protein [Burkholderiales bacterium]
MKYTLLFGASYLLLNASSAQELSTARYVGSLEGAAQACAEAFPQKAAIYNDTLYRSVKCHLSEPEFQQWRNKLRNQAPHREQYLKAYAEGKNSLSDHPANRKRECASLESLACDPGSDPRRDPDFKK